MSCVLWSGHGYRKQTYAFGECSSLKASGVGDQAQWREGLWVFMAVFVVFYIIGVWGCGPSFPRFLLCSFLRLLLPLNKAMPEHSSVWGWWDIVANGPPRPGCRACREWTFRIFYRSGPSESSLLAPSPFKMEGRQMVLVFHSTLWLKSWCWAGLALCFLAACSSKHSSNRDMERLFGDASGGRGLCLAPLQKEAKKNDYT